MAKKDDTASDEPATAASAPGVARAEPPLEPLQSAAEPASPSAGAVVAGDAPTPPSDSPGLVSRETQIDAALYTWMRSLSSSPLSQHTASWNYLRAKLPALRDLLMEI